MRARWRRSAAMTSGVTASFSGSAYLPQAFQGLTVIGVELGPAEELLDREVFGTRNIFRKLH
jgi:hypothetical protein